MSSNRGENDKNGKYDTSQFHISTIALDYTGGIHGCVDRYQ